jgi:hypothetical protein
LVRFEWPSWRIAAAFFIFQQFLLKNSGDAGGEKYAGPVIFLKLSAP